MIGILRSDSFTSSCCFLTVHLIFSKVRLFCKARNVLIMLSNFFLKLFWSILKFLTTLCESLIGQLSDSYHGAPQESVLHPVPCFWFTCLILYLKLLLYSTQAIFTNIGICDAPLLTVNTRVEEFCVKFQNWPLALKCQ